MTIKALHGHRVAKPIRNTLCSRRQGEALVFGAMDALALKALQGDSDVFYDSSHNLLSVRDKAREFASGVGAAAILVWVDTPLDLAETRVATRTENDMTSNPPLTVVRGYPLERPRPHENSVIIDGQLPVEEQFAAFTAARHVQTL